MPDDVSDWLAKLGLSKYVQQRDMQQRVQRRDRHPGCKLLSATQCLLVSKVGIG